MKCRKALFTFLLFSPLAYYLPCMAQEVTDVTKITFLDPGVSYEKAIGKNQAIYGHAFFAASFAAGFSSSLGTRTSFKLEPAVAVQYRYYYNFANRQAKNKRTEMNSLN